MTQQRGLNFSALKAEVQAAYEKYDSTADQAAAAKAAWMAAEDKKLQSQADIVRAGKRSPTGLAAWWCCANLYIC